MPRIPWCPRAYAPALLFAVFFAVLPSSDALAHCFVGARFFPATLATDDPCVADEMSLPTVSWMKTADIPPAGELDVSAELSKRITEDFGISIGETWKQIRGPGGPTMAGFDNLETTAQYQLLKDNSHELAMLLGLIVDWSNTGAINSGIATPYSTLTPTYYFGKGFGDLPDGGRMVPRLRGDRSGRLSNPDRNPSMSCRILSFRRSWSMADRCNTACRT